MNIDPNHSCLQSLTIFGEVILSYLYTQAHIRKILLINSISHRWTQKQEGRGDICSKMDQYGHGRGTVHGGCSEFSIVRSKFCYQMKRDITPTQAVLLEPMGMSMRWKDFKNGNCIQPHFLSGVAYNGIEKIDVKGKDILIIGAGAIGLLGAACAKAIGEYW